MTTYQCSISGNDEPEDNLRILYVEDTKSDQLIMRRLLSEKIELAFEIITVDTAADALRRIEKSEFDLLILDYKLPGMTGLEFLAELEKRNIEIPVIFVTGKGDEKIAVEAMKRGVKDYIVKDEISSERLVRAIKEIFLLNKLPAGIDLDKVIRVAELFSKSSFLEIETVHTLRVPWDSSISASNMVLTLDKLAESGLIEFSPHKSVVSCPFCGSHEFQFDLECPECRNHCLMKGEAIEHMRCGNTDFASSFDNPEGEKLCPKCGGEIRQIGVDYRKIGSYYRCPDGHFFGQPLLTLKCSKCSEKFGFDEAPLKILNRYQLTEKGRQQLRPGLLKTEMINKE